MNHVVNPISFRLGVSRFWNATWATSTDANYSYINYSFIKLDRFFKQYFERIHERFRSFMAVSNVKYFINFSYIYVFIYMKIQTRVANSYNDYVTAASLHLMRRYSKLFYKIITLFFKHRRLFSITKKYPEYSGFIKKQSLDFKTQFLSSPARKIKTQATQKSKPANLKKIKEITKPHNLSLLQRKVPTVASSFKNKHPYNSKGRPANYRNNVNKKTTPIKKTFFSKIKDYSTTFKSKNTNIQTFENKYKNTQVWTFENRNENTQIFPNKNKNIQNYSNKGKNIQIFNKSKNKNIQTYSDKNKNSLNFKNKNKTVYKPRSFQKNYKHNSFNKNNNKKPYWNRKQNYKNNKKPYWNKNYKKNYKKAPRIKISKKRRVAIWQALTLRKTAINNISHVVFKQQLHASAPQYRLLQKTFSPDTAQNIKRYPIKDFYQQFTHFVSPRKLPRNLRATDTFSSHENYLQADFLPKIPLLLQLVQGGVSKLNIRRKKYLKLNISKNKYPRLFKKKGKFKFKAISLLKRKSTYALRQGKKRKAAISKVLSFHKRQRIKSLISSFPFLYPMESRALLSKNKFVKKFSTYLNIRNLALSAFQAVYSKYSFGLYKKMISIDFSKFFRRPSSNIGIFFVLLPQDSFSANFLAKYIRLKLLHKFPLNVLVNQLFHNLKKGMYYKDLQGFKLIFSGRFARKERATYKVKFAGRTPLSSVATIVDYGFSQVVLLNSICGIKVWLTRNTPVRRALVL